MFMNENRKVIIKPQQAIVNIRFSTECNSIVLIPIVNFKLIIHNLLNLKKRF